MAASPMTLFPCISTLFTVNLYCNFRAHDGAKSASRAFAVVNKTNRPVSTDVVFACRLNVPFLAGLNTKMTFLAKLLANNDFPLQDSKLLANEL
jgi:hypothetical protein